MSAGGPAVQPHGVRRREMNIRGLRRRRRIVDAAVISLIVASGIAMHALWPSVVGRKNVSDVIGEAVVAFVGAFVFFFLAVFSGRSRKGRLEVSPWFALLVFGAIGFFLFGAIEIGGLNGGTLAAGVWAAVLLVLWSAGRLTHRTTARYGPNQALHATRGKAPRAHER